MPLLPSLRPVRLFQRLAVFDRTIGGDVEIRISLRQRLAPLLLALALAWYLFSPTGPALVLLITLGLFLLSAYLWARAMAQNVSGQRTLRYAAVQVGDELEEQVTLSNASQLPVLWAEFSDHSDLPGYTVTRRRQPRNHHLAGSYHLHPAGRVLAGPLGTAPWRAFRPV
jgi:hypothetical protein